MKFVHWSVCGMFELRDAGLCARPKAVQSDFIFLSSSFISFYIITFFILQYPALQSFIFFYLSYILLRSFVLIQGHYILGLLVFILNSA